MRKTRFVKSFTMCLYRAYKTFFTMWIYLRQRQKFRTFLVLALLFWRGIVPSIAFQRVILFRQSGIRFYVIALIRSTPSPMWSCVPFIEIFWRMRDQVS